MIDKSKNINFKLKESTKKIHQDLHNHPLTKLLISKDLKLSQYKSILEAFYGFYYKCERQIESDESNSRIKWLEKDLNFYDIDIAKLRICSDIPILNSQNSLLGYLYVTEGSTLGSLTIAKTLKSVLGVDYEHGARFFSAYGQETMSKWQDFQNKLERTELNDQEEIINSALDTFHKLESWLTICNEED